MSTIIPFPEKPRNHKKKTRKTTTGARKKAILCDNNHHKWRTDKQTRFDVKAGKLVTVERCEYCGKIRNTLR